MKWRRALLALSLAVLPLVGARAQGNAGAEAVDMVDLAQRLSEAGARSLGPQALLMAAQIALDHPARLLSARPNERLTRSGSDTLPAFDVASLLARAEAMAATDSTLLVLIERLRIRLRGASRGVLKGPRLGTYSIAGGGVHEFRLGFVPGEPAVVRVRASSASSLSCDVLDSQGTVLRSDRATSYCVLNFRPSSAGVLRVRIRSAEASPIAYVLITN